jgi:hypothetical protein
MFPGKFAAAKIKESAYGFSYPISLNSFVIQVEMP